ncbi:MAG TPA: tetratricopeptide repeat protein [Chloroflexi bacterium]|nr:tetratricopeptide repeat protein [Chloroflexota bacterium]
MTQEPKTPPKPRSAHSVNKRELRASLYLPIVIILGIWVMGLLAYVATPGDFNTAVGIAVSAALFLYLVYWTRNAPARTRMIAILLAVPALVGITMGMVYGRASYTIGGVSLTVLLLIIYRALSTPVSYRFAYRHFQNGNNEAALHLINRAIATRPNYWESYQLKALIYLSQMDFARAEESARDGLAVKPDAPSLHNTLGQIHLAQTNFAAARDQFLHAVEGDPDNAITWYFLGLSQYRLEDYRDSAESLTAAIKNTLRYVDFELLAHYYLWRNLQALEMDDEAAQIQEKLPEFADGLPILQAQLAEQADYPHAEMMRADLAEIENVMRDA